MGRCVGFTESQWRCMPDDDKQKWRYFSAAIRCIGAYLVTKTGNVYVDMALSALVAIAIALVIDPQRSYSGLSPQFRKRNTRIAIALATTGIVVLGGCMFAQACLTSTAAALLDNSNRVAPDPIVRLLTTVIFLAISPFAYVKVFRDLRLGELIYRKPREGLIRIFVRKEVQAKNFIQFATIEVTVLWVCLIYISVAAEMTKTLLSLVRVFG